MANELNDLTYNNTNISFTTQTNNIATSDETTASPIYQDKMGTAYSRSKSVVRAFNFAGISLILTAAAIKTGSLISNVYILNPPSVKDATYEVETHTFTGEFTISNLGKYQIYYFLTVNGEEVLKEDCSEEKSYLVTYENLKQGDEGHFYIEFTNKVDYKKTIDSYRFKVEA